MKKIFKSAMLFVAASTMAFSLSSCSDSNDDNGGNSNAGAPVMKAIVDNYVDNIVEPTYNNLATNAQTLYDACQNLYAKRKAGSLTQDDIDAACEAFKAARKYWEQSESFLYGAAKDNEIDPHIDSWPLDHSQLVSLLNNKDMIAGINGEQADKFVYESRKNLESVMGFHGLEFILFRDGANRTLAALTAEKETAEGLTSVNTVDECAFAAAISGDLRNMISLLAYGWAGDAVSSSIKSVVDKAPWTVAATKNAGFSPLNVCYSTYLKSATTATGMFKTWQETVSNIISGGCSDIAQEVFTQKLGQAYRVAAGQGKGDDAIDYIESPYSKRSFQDYQDNIYSIKHSLYGTLDDNATAPVANSLMAFLKNNNYPNYDALSAALNDAIAALQAAKTSGKAFVDAPGDTQVKNCIDKVEALNDALGAAGSWILRQPAQ